MFDAYSIRLESRYSK